MQYPLISEYVRAIQDASDNLGELAHLVPVLDEHGEPYRSSGAFAVVFKMRDEQTGKCYALKCFTEEQEGRAEAYRMIADELECVDSSYVTSVRYLEKEIFVDSSCEEDEFSVLLMNWVEGETMETYIANNYQDEYAMAMLCYRFCKMAAWLRSQPFAHGDIKPDNIMVRPDGTLTLVDYDGMFVPAMKGQKSPTIGTKDFSHPLRTIDDFDETIDDFALATIALSLKAISLKPSLLDEYGAADRLLFSADDYRNLSKSKVMSALLELMSGEEINTLFSMFLLANAKKNLAMCSFRLFVGKKPKCEIENLSTEVTGNDLKNAVVDEYGVKYSKNGKKLLRVPYKLTGNYSIRRGTMIICSDSFYLCYKITSVVIPDSVISIGDCVFGECESLTSVVIPQSVKEIKGNPFFKWNGKIECLSPNFVLENDILFDKKKTKIISFRQYTESYVIPKGVSCIGNKAFGYRHSLNNVIISNSVTSIGEGAFKDCWSLANIVIPNSVTSIGEGAFKDCWSLANIVIPNSVTSIGDSAFSGCKSLSSVVIPESVISIGDSAFSFCKSLSSLVIPHSVRVLRGNPFFMWGGKLDFFSRNYVYENGTLFDKEKNKIISCRKYAETLFAVPDSVTIIEHGAFCNCSSLTSIVIPNGITSIGDGAFSGCKSLSSVVIPNSVTSIGDSAFSGCKSLSSVVISNSITSIGEGAFKECSSLSSLVIPNSVTSIGDRAFYGCKSLSSVVIPNSITSIGGNAFGWCSSLSSFVIPDSVTSIKNDTFFHCESLTSIVIPDSVMSIGKMAFYSCKSLTSIVIPDSVMSIGEKAFTYCNLSGMEEELICRFGDEIFNNCSFKVNDETKYFLLS